jgi:hypothetical protein
MNLIDFSDLFIERIKNTRNLFLKNKIIFIIIKKLILNIFHFQDSIRKIKRNNKSYLK